MLKKFMNKKIVLLGLGLLLVITTVVVSISAWLTDTETKGPVTFTIGEVSYTLNGAFISADGPIVPGESLITTPFTLTNSSTVSSQIRFYIDIEVGTNKKDNAEPADLNTYFTSSTSGAGVTIGTDWTYDNGFWYYKSVSGEDSKIATTMTTPIPLLDQIKLDGSKIGNDYETEYVKITITFQAKQAEYVTWAELGSVDWGSGLPSLP